MLKYFLELRNKFVLLIATSFSTLLVCYWYKNVLLFFVTQMHLNEANLYFIFTDVKELFSVYFKISFFVTTQVSSWYFFYHLFSFLIPGLYFSEFKFLNFLFIGSTFFWFLASCFSSYILIPFSWSFFSSFQFQQGFYFEARIDEYLTFYTQVYFLCLVYYQLFMLLFIFFVDIKQNYCYVKKYRKLYYYVFLLFATLSTPPDLISQIFATFFLVLIYETIVLVLVFSFYLKFTHLVANYSLQVTP